MTNHERIQRAVDRRLDTLHVSAPAFSPVSFTPRRRFHPFRRVIAVAAVAAVTFVGSVSVLAASFPPIQRLVEQVGVQLASIMQTVELSCVSDDIEMQVLAAVNDNQRVTVYLSLRDQAGGRVNEKTVLSNLQIDGTLGPCDVQLVDYDSSTGNFIYRLSGYSVDALNGKPITVQVRTLLNDVEDSHRQNTGYSLSLLKDQTPSLQEGVSINGSSIVYDPNGFSPFEDAPPSILEAAPLPDGWNPELPWGTITAIGFVQDTLHVQVKVSELGRYARADLYLLDSNGQPLNAGSGTYEFGHQYSELDADYSEYIEYVLPVPKSYSLDDLSLYYDAISYDSAMRGDWKVTFTLDSVYKQQSADCDITLDSVHYTQVTLSPLGISLHGDGQPVNGEYPSVEVYDTNGKKIDFYTSSTIFSFDEQDQVSITLQQDFRVPLSPENIGQVLVDGQELQFS